MPSSTSAKGSTASSAKATSSSLSVSDLSESPSDSDRRSRKKTSLHAEQRTWVPCSGTRDSSSWKRASQFKQVTINDGPLSLASSESP